MARVSRETRLLVLTLAVSIGALLVLAQFRFPHAPRPQPDMPQPLERLAARATYAELAAIMGEVDAHITPSVVTLRLARTLPEGQRSAESEQPMFRPALRVRDDVALALIENDVAVQGLVSEADATPVVMAHDPTTGLALVRTPPRALPNVQAWADAPRLGPLQYVAVAEGARGGVAIRPTFIGRVDPLVDPRWDGPLQALDNPELEPGMFLFSLEGRLLGLVLGSESSTALLPASAIIESAERLLSGTMAPEGWLGLEVQPLTPAIAAATSAQFGAIVSHVTPGGPADGRLQPGDVIEAVDGEAVHSAASIRVHISRSAPGNTIELSGRRFGEPFSAVVEVRPADAATTRAVLGVLLRSAPKVGSEVVTVELASAGARAGLLGGDLITQIGERRAPSPTDIERLYEAAKVGERLLLVVQRQSHHRVLVLERS